MSIENKSFTQLIREVKLARKGSEEYYVAIRELDLAIREFLNTTKNLSHEELMKHSKYKDYLAAETALKNEPVTKAELDDLRGGTKKSSKKDQKSKPRRAVKDGQTGTIVTTDQLRTRSTPFSRILGDSTKVKLGQNTKVKDVMMASIFEDLGIDIYEMAKHRKELGAREVVDKETGEKKLTRKYGVGVFDYASDVARRLGIQGVGELKQYKTKFIPDPVPLKQGYSLTIDAKGMYYYKDSNGNAVKSSEALTSSPSVNATKESTTYSFTDNKSEKRFRIQPSAGDVFKASILESLGIDLTAIHEDEVERGIVNKYGDVLDGERSRLGRLYGRLNATRVVKSEEKPTLTSNKPTKTRSRKKSKMGFEGPTPDFFNQSAKTEDTVGSAEPSETSEVTPKVRYRKIQPSAGDVFKATFLEDLGFNLRAFHEDEVERGIVNKHGEYLNENGDVVAEGKRSRLGALYSRLNKYEKVGGSKAGSSNKSMDAAVNAFKSADRTLKQVEAVRANQEEAQERASEQPHPERRLQAPEGATQQGGMSAVDLLAEMLPDITKQIVDLTQALKEQGDKIGNDVSKAEGEQKKAEDSQRQSGPSKPKFRMSSLSPKAKKAAAGAAVAGGVALAGYMATKGRLGQAAQQGTTGIVGMISSITGSIGQTASNLFDNASELLVGLKPAGDSAHAGQAMAYFMSQGWTKQQAAGIVGNLQQESGANLDPNAHNSIGMFGIAQWDTIRRNRYQKNSGKSIYQSSFIDQLGYVNWELNNTHKNAGNALRKATDATTAAQIVQNLYEGAPGQDDNKRIVNAKFLAGEEITDSSVLGRIGAVTNAVISSAQSLVGMGAAQLKEYLKAGGYNWSGENWCAEFVNATLARSGIQGSGSAVANSFQRWGVGIRPQDVQPGDVVLETRGLPAGQPGGHVGIAVGVFNGGKIPFLAGNSGRGGANQTTVKQYNINASEPGLIVRRASGPKPEQRQATNWPMGGAWDNAIRKTKLVLVPVPVGSKGGPLSLGYSKQPAPSGSSIRANPGQLLRAHF